MQVCLVAAACQARLSAHMHTNTHTAATKVGFFAGRCFTSWKACRLATAEESLSSCKAPADTHGCYANSKRPVLHTANTRGPNNSSSDASDHQHATHLLVRASTRAQVPMVPAARITTEGAARCCCCCCLAVGPAVGLLGRPIHGPPDNVATERSTAWHGMAQHSTVQHSVGQNSMAQNITDQQNGCQPKGLGRACFGNF